MRRYFCTYFDARFLARGLALIHSLAQHCPNFKLWVLCMDDITHSVLAKLMLPGVELIRIADFERGDDALVATKRERTALEYYFTCTPSLPLYVFRVSPEPELITYLDADLFLFANPEPAFAEMGERSIAIVGHRRTANMRDDRVGRGRYNVGWLSFRRDVNGLACLHWWRQRCLEWCYARVEEGKFGDQRYLDEWPDRFSCVIVLEHKGVNTAPWNMHNYHFTIDQSGGIRVDGQPLIAFHFSGLRQLRSWLYELCRPNTVSPINSILRRKVYGRYIRQCQASAHLLAEVMDLAAPDDIVDHPVQYLSPARSVRSPVSLGAWLWAQRRRAKMAVRNLIARHYMVYYRNRVIV